jgi:hypothetical protein
MSSAVCQCVAIQGVPASYPPLLFVYPSKTKTMSTHPTPSTSTVVILIPHQSLGLVSGGCGKSGYACLELRIGSDHKALLPQLPPPPRLMNWSLPDVAQVGPDATIAPTRGLGFDPLNAWQPRRIPRRHPMRPTPRHPKRSSLLLSARVSSPTNVFSRVSSGAKRASDLVC